MEGKRAVSVFIKTLTLLGIIRSCSGSKHIIPRNYPLSSVIRWRLYFPKTVPLMRCSSQARINKEGRRS